MTCALLLDMFFTAADLARLRRCLTDTARLAGLAGLAEPQRVRVRVSGARGDR